MSSTDLVLTGMGIPPYSARGLSQTLELVDTAASFRRTLNGTLVFTGMTEQRKYRSRITCEDMDAPALDGIWPGSQLTVDCIAELAYAEGGTAQRTAVAGSSRTADGYTFYRPQLTMLVTGFQWTTDEWGARVGWTLDLEEV